MRRSVVSTVLLEIEQFCQQKKTVYVFIGISLSLNVSFSILNMRVECAPFPTPLVVPGTSKATSQLQERWGKSTRKFFEDSEDTPAVTPVRNLSPADRFLADAETALCAQDFDRAMRIFKSAAMQFPKDLRARLGQARILYATNDLPGAHQLLTRLVAEHPDFGPAFALLGKVECSIGNSAAGEKAYRAAVKLNPSDAGSHFCLAQIVQSRGLLNEAFEEASACVKLDPHNTGARLILSLYLENNGQLEEAAKQLDSALKVDPNNGRILSQLGTLLRSRGKSTAAIENLKKARALDPSDATILEEIAFIYGARNDWINAREYAEEWTKLEPDNPASWFMLAWSCKSTNELSDASSFYKKAIQLDSSNANLHNAYGLVLLDLRKSDDAAKEFRKAIELAPSDIGPRLNLGILFVSGNRWTEAIDWARSTTIRFPESAESLGLLAYACAAAGEFQDGAIAAQTALALKRDDGLALVALSMVKADEGKLDDAIDELKKNLEVNPLSAFALTELARAYLKKGDARKAITLVQQALQIAPSNLQAKATMAEALKKLGNYQGAVLLLKECVVRSPHDLSLKLSLADAQEKCFDRDGAISTLEKARKTHPSSAEPPGQLARYALADKNLKEAEPLARESLLYNKQYLPSLMVLSEVLFQKGKLDACAEQCEKMLLIKPNDANVNLISGRCYFRLRRWNDARQCLECAAIAGATLAVSDGMMRSECLEKSEELQRAAEVLTEILRDDGNPKLTREEIKELKIQKSRVEKRLRDLSG